MEIDINNAESKMSDKKYIQKKRIIKYFIDAVKQIQEDEGLKAVTIRKVADIAGYNSATLYNYFENLDHLLLFASMDYFQEYVDQLPKRLKDVRDPIQRYIIVAECFYKNSFLHPQNFYSIFFAKVSNSIDEYIRDYYELFPIDTSEMDEDIATMVRETDLFSRGSISIKKCIDEGFFTKEEGIELNDIMIYVYESFLYRVIHDEIDPAEANEKINKYLSNIIKKYRIK
ncbi:TetR/AcrR family transcriptional regulator [Proteocatella sphenisci]|uniref:TetR/AcrR family transcriptional regulator n=1 Tax=Proteocatella sphenisci TaxID=181070 RepID=UPI000490A8A5|nr:TetR/AcrR family transcriptional regulator [Proteocatella sphenisci]